MRRGNGWFGACAVAAAWAAAGAEPELKAPEAPEALRTIAEKSGFAQTSRHAEVVSLLDAIAASSPLARRVEMGKTGEGRSIPVIVLADPPVATAREAREQARTRGKPLVLLFGNIHAGECDGKEALLMLARELTRGDEGTLAKMVVAIAPIYNADGNEKVGPGSTHRPGQNGPAEVGVRENAKGLDLNRDFIKLEAPETKALVSFVNEWNPAVVVDCHTTNGSNHRYLVTHAGPKAPAGPADVVAFSHGVMLPSIAQRFHAATGRDAFWYGNFEGEFGDAPRGYTRWETFPAEARFGTTYFGLRGIQSVLVESYSYAPFRERVLGSYEYCRAILGFVGENAGKLLQPPAAAKEGDSIVLRTKPVSAGRAKVKGFVEKEENGRRVSTGEPRDYDLEIWDSFGPALSVKMPIGYLVSFGMDKVIAKLAEHGIRPAAVPPGEVWTLGVYKIKDATPASRAFQGHALVKVEAELVQTSRPAVGTYAYFPATGPLGRLTCYLLEPQCEDGLATWNYFDASLKPGGEFPVMRLIKAGEAAR